jgi:tetratricopeptide (TPR) repeat protein
MKAKAHFAVREYRKTIEECTNSLKYGKENCDIYNDRAVAYVRIGEYEKAYDDFANIMVINKKYVQVYFNMGKLLEDMGDKVKAIAYFKVAAEKGDDNAIEKMASYGIDYITKAMMERVEKMGSIYDWVAWFEKGRVLRDFLYDGVLIDFDEEILDCFNKALAKSQENEVVLFEKAKILALLRRKDEALVLLESLLNKYRNNIEVMMEIVNIFADRNEYARAIEILSRVLLIDPKNEVANYQIQYFKDIM